MSGLLRRALVICLAIAGAAVVLACTPGKPATLAGSRLAVRWTGADTADFTAAATAARCDTLHVIEIRAISGDTGVGLALYDSGSVRPGTYPIRPPDTADSTAPAAALALRWFSKTAVQGFQGDSGEVTVRRTGAGVLSGSFTGKAHAINGSGRLELTGSFDNLQVVPAARGCEPPPADDSTATSPDSSGVVH